jgi:PiT family inorganic phosphate transporter
LIGVAKIIVSLIISPLLGFLAAFVLQTVMIVALRNASFNINVWIKKLQWLIAALLAYSHGANDAQKIVGIILIALTSAGYSNNHLSQEWIKGIAGIVMFLGTMLGGWSIMKTVGRGIFAIRPLHSLNSQISSGSSIILATFFGAPVSTTHIVVGSVAGVGTADEIRMVNWQIGKEIIIAWLFTIPLAATVAAIIYYLLDCIL